MRFRSITESELVDLLYPPPHDGRGGGGSAHTYALYWRCGALCWRLWSTRLCWLECNQGLVLRQPWTVV